MAKKVTTEVLEFETEYPVDENNCFIVKKQYLSDGTVDESTIMYVEYKPFNGKRIIANIETFQVNRMKKFIQKITKKKNIDFNF
jgi:hypothetical protein